MSRNVNISPLFNSLKIYTNDGDFFWMKPNGNLTSSNTNVKLYSKNEYNITSENGILLKSRNSDLSFDSEKGNILFKSDQAIDFDNQNINFRCNNFSINSDALTNNIIKSITNVNNDNTRVLEEGDYVIDANNDIRFYSSDISLESSNLLNIQANNLDITNNSLEDGLKMNNNNIIFGDGSIENYSILYDKKMKIVLKNINTDDIVDSSLTNEINDGINIESYIPVDTSNIIVKNPQLSISKIKLLQNTDFNSEAFTVSNLRLGAGNNNSFLDIQSKGSFDIIKDKSNMLSFDSVNGITVGENNNSSNISNFDIVKSSTNIADVENTLNQNYFDFSNIENPSYNIYCYLRRESPDSSTFFLEMKGLSLLDNNYISFVKLVETITSISEQYTYFKPKIVCRKEIDVDDTYIIGVTWISVINASYKINCKFYYLNFNQDGIQLDVTDILKSDGSSIFQINTLELDIPIHSYDFIDLYDIKVIDNYFLISYIVNGVSVNNSVLKTKLLLLQFNSDGSAFLDVDDNTYNSNNVNIIQPKLLFLSKNDADNDSRIRFLQTLKIYDSEKKKYKLNYRYGVINENTSPISLHLLTDFISINYWSNLQSNYNYDVGNYNISKSSITNDNINLDFFVSWYNKFNPNIETNEISSSFLFLHQDKNLLLVDNFRISITNIIGNNVILNENIYRSSVNELITKEIFAGDIVYLNNEYGFKRIKSIVNDSVNNNYVLEFSNDNFNLLGMNIASNLDVNYLTDQVVVDSSTLQETKLKISDTLRTIENSDSWNKNVNISPLVLNNSLITELNINDNYILVNWINSDLTNNYLEYAFIKIDSFELAFTKLKYTNYNLFNNYVINTDYQNENLVIIIFNKFSDVTSEDNIIQYAVIHHPDIPILRVTDFNQNLENNTINNDYFISNNGISYRHDDPNFSFINLNSTSQDNLKNEIEFKYNDENNNLLNIAKLQSEKIDTQHSLNIIVADENGEYTDSVGIKFLKGGLGSLEFKGSINNNNCITLENNLQELFITSSDINSSTFLDNYDNTIESFNLLKSNFRQGDKFLLGSAINTDPIFAITNKSDSNNNIELNEYQSNITNVNTNQISLLPSILYAYDYIGDTKLLLDYFGNFGIGTSNPKYNLDIENITTNLNLTSTIESSNLANNNILFSYKYNNKVYSDFNINYVKDTNDKSMVLFDIDGRTKDTRENNENTESSWKTKLKITENGIGVGKIESGLSLDSYTLLVAGDSFQKPNLGIINNTPATTNSVIIDGFTNYETRISFLGNYNNITEFSRISGRIDKNISGINESTPNGSIEFRTKGSNNDFSDGGVLYLDSSSKLSINHTSPRSYLDIKSDRAFNTSNLGDLNIWNTQEETSISFSNGSTNNTKSLLCYVNKSGIVPNMSIQFEKEAGIFTNNFHFTKNSNFVITDEDLFSGSNTVYDQISNSIFSSSSNTFSIKKTNNFPNKHFNYAHLFTKNNITINGLEATSLYIMPSPNDDTTENHYYQLSGSYVTPSSSFSISNLITSPPPIGYSFLKYIDTASSIDNIPEYKIFSSQHENKNWFDIPLFYNNKDNNEATNRFELLKFQQDTADPSNDKLGINVNVSSTSTLTHTLEVNGSIGASSIVAEQTTLSKTILDYVIYDGNQETSELENKNLILLNVTASGQTFTIPDSYEVDGMQLKLKNISTQDITLAVTSSSVSLETGIETLASNSGITLVFIGNTFYSI